MSSRDCLLELQQMIQAAIHQGAWPEELDSFIAGDCRRSARERMDVYQDAYRIRMTTSLCEDFSRVENVLGRGELKALAWEFIQENPSTVRNLAEYGEAFPEFLRRKSGRIYRYAEIDWLEILSFHASVSNDVATPQEIANGLPFVLAFNEATKYYANAEETIVLYRFQNEVHEIQLNARQAMLLSFLKGERMLAEVEAFSQSHDISPEEMVSCLTAWLERSILICRKVEDDSNRSTLQKF